MIPQHVRRYLGWLIDISVKGKCTMIDTIDKTLLSQVVEDIKTYGHAVILNRAVPDFRDGLKPVHRRVLWSLYTLGLKNSGPFKKSARTVGECVGVYHPHGEAAVYGSLVNMCSQLPQQLIAGEGNFGDHNDPAAAMRYCFTGDTRISTEYGLIRIKDIRNYAISEDDEAPIRVRVNSIGGEQLATKWIFSGVFETYTMNTVTGHSVSCTSNEPFYVLHEDLTHGWIPLSELSSSSVVCMSTNVISTISCKSISTVIDGMPLFMSHELAELLGYTVSAGIVDGGSVVYQDPDSNIRRLLCDLFSTEVCAIGNTLRVTDVLVLSHLSILGALDGCVPNCVWESSSYEVASFIYGIYRSGEITYSEYSSFVSGQTLCGSVSLLGDVKTLLISSLGIVTGPISFDPESNTNIVYVDAGSLSKFYDLIKHSNVGCCPAINVNVLPSFVVPAILKQIEGFKERIQCGSLYTEIISNLNTVKTVEDLGEFINNHRNTFDRCMDPAFLGKIRAIVLNKFFYTTPYSIINGGKQEVYDLFVPSTNAFIADGFVVHNTESKLSKYSETFLLDPDYLKVMPMIPNYSDDKMEPLYLPAKLPHILINGSEGIAVGIAQSIPSFSLESVLKCTILALNGKLTEKKMASILKPEFKWGGTALDTDGIKSLCSTGKGIISYIADHTVDFDKKLITIDSTAPRLSFYKRKKGEKATAKNSIVESLSEINGVVSVVDATGRDKKTGEKKISIRINTNKRITSQKFDDVVSAVRAKISTRVSYNVVVTERHDTGNIDVWESTLFGIMMDWVDWRIDFEIKVINQKILDLTVKLNNVRLMLLAIRNIAIIKKALDVKDAVRFLVSELDVTVEQASKILDFKIRQLTKVERVNLLKQIKEYKDNILLLRSDISNPKPRIVNGIDMSNKSLLKR